MQTNHLDIYKKVSESTGIDEEIYKDIGSFIFRETAKMLKEPSSLILKLKGIGSWHLRKKRMEIVINEWEHRGEEKDRSEFSSDNAYEIYLEKHKQYINFQERLKEYEEYLNIKSEIRKQRNETQILFEPDEGKDEGS